MLIFSIKTPTARGLNLHEPGLAVPYERRPCNLYSYSGLWKGAAVIESVTDAQSATLIGDFYDSRISRPVAQRAGDIVVIDA